MIRAALCVILLILARAATAQEAGKPQVEVTFEQTETIPGQPLDLRVTVLVPTWMTQPVVFPSLDAPNLLVRLPGRATMPLSRRVGGETWSGVSRRYRLTPLVEGSFTVPDQPLIVTWSDPDTGKPRKDTATMPGIAFRAVRPEGTETLDPFIAATALTLSQDLSGAEAPLKPGDSVTRVVTATISGAPPMLLPALIPSTPVQGVAQYPAEPVLTEDDGPDGISGTRRESVTYLAQGGGTGTAAPIELPWFNLTTGRIETAGLPGVDLTVDAPVASGLRSLDPRWVVAAAVASAAALAAILFVARRLWRRWRRVRADRLARYRASARWARKQALRAAAARDLDATLRALDLWAARSDRDPRADPAVCAVLLTIGRACYGPDTAPKQAVGWRQLVTALRALGSRHHRATALWDKLPPLNPASAPPFTDPEHPMTRLFLVLSIVAAMLATTASAQPKSTEAPHYVGSASCAACHTTESAAWKGSDHALAWTEPSPDTVLGDFDDAETTLDGARVRLSTEGGAYMVSITGPDGTEARYPVHSVAGVRPLQQYLLETEPGRLQSFDLAWDTRGQRWYDLYPDQDLNPGEGLHWTGPYKTWNGRCAECHATGFRKNYDPQSRRYASTQAEMGVGCEACHGPGSRHVDWAERNRETPVAPPAHYGFTMDFATAGTEALIQQCAGCHSRREPLGDGNPLPGTAFSDAYRLALLRPGLYHADGQILDEVYVYGSFLQSKMYAKGVGCMNCHEPHSATLRAPDNTLCTQCHSPAGNPDFPSLPKRLYDDPAHHFHETGSAGAQCKSCHMIERTYMGVDGRRDHSFRIPRPDLDRVTGAPDACTDCHADRSPDWAAAEIAKRHPRSAARPHYGVTLARGRADPQAARAALLDLAADTGQPGVVRATALWLVEQRADRPAADRAATMLDDPDPLVRAAAIGVQRAAGPQDRVQRVLPRLNDPAKMVRIQAAKALLGAPIAHMPAKMAASMRRAMSEWQASLVARADFPETHMVIGGTALTMRNTPAALEAFREVVRMDPQREEAWVMLVRITAATRGAEATKAVLDQALAANPGSDVLTRMRDSIGR